MPGGITEVIGTGRELKQDLRGQHLRSELLVLMFANSGLAERTARLTPF